MRATPPDTRCVFPEQTPRNVTGVLQPAFSGISRRSFGSRRPRALDCRPHGRGNPRLPRIRVPCAECVQNACVRPRLRRSASRRRRDRPLRAHRRRTPQVVAARTRAPRRRRRRDCAPRRASRRRSTHRGDGFERQLSSGLKGPRPAFKRRSTRSRARGLPPRFFWVKRASRVFFSFLMFLVYTSRSRNPSTPPSRARRTKPKPENLTFPLPITRLSPTTTRTQTFRGRDAPRQPASAQRRVAGRRRCTRRGGAGAAVAHRRAARLRAAARRRSRPSPGAFPDGAQRARVLARGRQGGPREEPGGGSGGQQARPGAGSCRARAAAPAPVGFDPTRLVRAAEAHREAGAERARVRLPRSPRRGLA